MPRGLPGRWMGGFESDCHISSDPRKIQIVALKIAAKLNSFSF